MFSINFAASATLILDALCVPASIIDSYSSATISRISSDDAETIFTVFVRVLTLSPGLILSGLYPQ